MKRFTSLMLMLLCAVATFAQELVQITTDTSNPIYYTIYNTRSDSPGGLLYYAGDDAGLKDGCNVTTLEDKYKFYFTGSDDALYVHNAATTNKLASVGSWTAEGSVWCVIKRNDGNLAFGPKGANQDEKVWWNEQNQGRDGYTEWTANDAGSGFVVELASEFTYPEVGKFYTLEAPLFEKVQGVAKGLVANGGNALGWNTVDLSNKNYYWTLVKDDETNALYLKNVGTGYYINGDAVRENAAALTTNALGSNQFNIITNGTKLHAVGHDSGNGANGGVTGWNGAANSASAWKFVEREDPDAVQVVEVTYNFVYDGETKYSQTYNTIVGEQYQAITVTLPFGVSVAAPTGEILAEDIVVVDGVNTITKELELTISNMPFAFADSYANVKWQFLKFDSNNGFYLHHVAGQDYLALDVKNFNPDDDKYYWGFVGNPFDGYRIVNKGAGDGYILSSSTTMAGETGANTWPIMTEEASLPEGNNTHWIPTKGAVDNGFFLEQKGYSQNRMNNRGSKLAYWTGGAGTGSTFIAEDPDVALAAVVDEFKTRAIEGLGYVGGYTADKADAINAIDAYDEMNAFKAANTTIAFDENKYYRVQNVYRTTFIAIENNNRVLRPEDHADIDQLWQVEAGTDGAYFIKSPNAGYMQAVGNNTLVAETDAQFVISSFYDGSGQFGIISKGTSDMLAGINASSLGTWWNGTIDGDMSYRFIETNDVEITLSDIDGEGWATTYLPFDVTLPEGLTAYYVNEVHDGWVNFAEAADVPAKNGVVLYTKEPKKYTLTIADATTEITGNHLRGTTVKTNIAEEAYVLSAPNNEVGFYKAKYNVSTDTTNDGTEEAPAVTYEAWLNNANKAYLVVPGASEVASYSFRFGEGTTGVENVVVENEVKAIYDLTGRRVENISAPGIYIVGGKKVLVR